MEPLKKSRISYSSTNKFSSIFYLLLMFIIPHSHSESDHTTLVYHHCTNNHPATSTSMSETTLSSLFESLIKQSTNSTFHKQITAHNGVHISAEYQCRGDMSLTNCKTCVTQLGILSNRLCAGAKTGRVQLRGCYVLYEADGEEVKEDQYGELLHKECGERTGGGGGGDYDAALWEVEEGILRSESGYFEGRNEGVRAVAQCEGALLGLGLGCDCAECVSRAVEVLRQDCSGSLDGDVYLQGCYVTYSTYSLLGDKKNGSSGKLVAIVLGGAATLGLGSILLMFFKSWGKKDDD